MAKKTGYLPPEWRSRLWQEHRLTEKMLLDSRRHLPSPLRAEFNKLWPAGLEQSVIAKIERLAALHCIAEKVRAAA